mmetsp:Transcript_665/g.1934  ORF Transcript_665/g.1934 Transcript_665/m.1934 type:complete len:211 (-) Transcript_665:239-871(-)
MVDAQDGSVPPSLAAPAQLPRGGRGGCARRQPHGARRDGGRREQRAPQGEVDGGAAARASDQHRHALVLLRLQQRVRLRAAARFQSLPRHLEHLVADAQAPKRCRRALGHGTDDGAHGLRLRLARRQPQGAPPALCPALDRFVGCAHAEVELAVVAAAQGLGAFGREEAGVGIIQLAHDPLARVRKLRLLALARGRFEAPGRCRAQQEQV